MKVAFYDRDGTIIEDYPDADQTDIENPVFVERFIDALKKVTSKGYKVVIITNQYLINEGFITLDQYNEVTQKMLNALEWHDIEILDIFYCLHSKKEECSCFKPQTGMIVQALEKYPSIDKAEYFIVVESLVDVELAINANIRGYGIGVVNTLQHKRICRLTSIAELKQYILRFLEGTKLKRNYGYTINEGRNLHG